MAPAERGVPRVQRGRMARQGRGQSPLEHTTTVLVLRANLAPTPASPIISPQPGLGLDSSLRLLHTPWSARELQHQQGPLPSSHPRKSTDFKNRSETRCLVDSQCHETSQAPAQLWDQPRDRQKTNKTSEGGSLLHLAARERVKTGSKLTFKYHLGRNQFMGKQGISKAHPLWC